MDIASSSVEPWIGDPLDAFVDPNRALGLDQNLPAAELAAERRRMVRYTNLQLIACGLTAPRNGGESEFTTLLEGLLDSYREKDRLLRDHRCPADQRIEAFLRDHFADLGLTEPPRLPGRTLVLDRHGMARELSLPVDGDQYVSPLLNSYRVKNGVLHNPRHDRRTTHGTFHVSEGGLPIPGDKKAVPKHVFAELLRHALQPPADMLRLPYTSNQPKQAETWVSLLIRPPVCPSVPGISPRKTMEIRFFAPGSLVSNLDFVESIFGNAGDPFVPDNDAGLDVEHWTGHSGAVILAPHLPSLTKKQLRLPHWDVATDRQRRDGMCWQNDQETYNDGEAFKLTCRTEAGVVVTLVADNYYGYCKKEVKTQISYAANLYGNVEEEHAGGAVARPSYNLGEEYQINSIRYNGRTFDDVARDYGALMDVHAEGYGIDRIYKDLIYIPEDAWASIPEQRIRWTRAGVLHSIPLLPGKIFMSPSGYQLRMEKHPAAPTWRLVGTVADGTFCHKPCTVSGGGKSEISKSLIDYMLYGPLFVADIDKDLDLVQQIFDKDYSIRWRPGGPVQPDYSKEPSRHVLDPRRSLGSVIKLLTPSADYTDEYNHWLDSLPNYIYALVFIIKRFQGPDWRASWRQHFGVDIVNGLPGHELKYRSRKLVGTYLRVGLLGPQIWRTYKLRQDFAPSAKQQMEDDISVSMVVPRSMRYGTGPAGDSPSLKFVSNCEYRLFQRPDDAIHRGLDKQTESDLARADNFLSNFEPLTRDDVSEMLKYVVDFDAFSPPMQQLLRSVDQTDSAYVVSSANPRKVDGKPTKNPRYLQTRPDLVRPLERYAAEMAMRLFRATPLDQPVLIPVHAVLLGRRNNPPDSAAGIHGLAVYNPIHYQELPELFMDLICSLTGKSPSTTGAGSEGALTKGPFNALLPTADLNTALVSFILTGLAGFSTSAGHIGPNIQVDHDISLLIPEIWCRLTAAERDPRLLIEEGLLEPLRDFDHQGDRILASRLGYRITHGFVRRFFGRVFDNPAKVFDQSLLAPESQDPDAFADGIKHITEAQKRVAQQYFEDGSIRYACPPLAALLWIMAKGSYDGRDVHHPDVRAMFTRDYLLSSSWYQQRLNTKQQRDIRLWRRHVEYLDQFLDQAHNSLVASRLDLTTRRERALAELAQVTSPDYLDKLRGTLGADPMTPA